MKEKVIIIGGGISGITTSLVLQILGYDTEIYARHLVGDGTEDPRFASKYPAASVIPHSVQSHRLASLFSISLKVFEALFEMGFTGVKKHRHFEVFEFPVEEPLYTRYLTNYSSIQQKYGEYIPHRQSAEKLYGWTFDCYVAEWFSYIEKLYHLYEKKGGRIYKKKVDAAEISNLSTDIIINCSGVWSEKLFEDEAKPKIVRGHIVQIPDKPKLLDSNEKICSYNYTPLLSAYSTPAGESCDVYFYPVNNKWILGGSRQTGTLNNDGKWIGKESGQTINIDGKKVPSQIIDLNRNILENTYNTSFQPDGNLKSFIGYRFERDGTENGLRLEKVRKFGKAVIHNYGHGGAGVTLSWGCALQVANFLNTYADPEKIVKSI